MRLSRFNLVAAGTPGPDDVLVHNTFAGSYVVLSRDHFSALVALDAGQPVDLSEARPSVAELSDRDVGVLCESYEAEDAEFLAWFEHHRARTDALEVLVSINRACNFACPYCLQDGVMDGAVMKPAMADRVALWIAERAEAAEVEAIVLGFAGGEPLLHPDRIERIVDGVRARTERPVSFRLITNGVYLSEARVVAWAARGLSAAQVTLDGDASTHRLTRISKRGDDTFATVFANAIAASRHIRVTINGNYQPDTVGGFAPLVDQLAEAGLPPGSSIKFSPALAGLDAPADAGSGACTWSESDTGMHVALHDHIRSRGFDAPPLSAVGPCEFHDHHSFAIDPDGTIYKCPGFLGKPRWGIGHVDEGLTRRYEEMIAATPQSSCNGCAHRPDCGGGCVAEAFLKADRLAGVTCERTHFQQVGDDAIRRGYARATGSRIPVNSTQAPGERHPPRPGREPIRPAALRVLS